MTRIFLGIESSCDDTAAAVVRDDRLILSSVVAGQTALHADFGGVVPEIAARAHAEKLDLCVEQALAQAGLRLDQLALEEVSVVQRDPGTRKTRTLWRERRALGAPAAGG